MAQQQNSCENREIEKLRSYCEASVGNFLTTYRDNISDPSSCPEDGTDKLSRNVANKLPLLAA
jgi:hypothetical protein